MTKTILLGCALFAGAAANADVVTFTGDSTGGKPNLWQSVESSNVTFSDTSGSDLDVSDFGNQSIGNGLAVFGDDASALLMNFSGPMNALSLDFGNDDPGFSSPGLVGYLEVFLGNVSVGFASVIADRDDTMNQTVSISGVGFFDSATFQYRDAAGAPEDLIEIVDNITFIPTPGALSLLAMGGLLAGRRRR